MTTKLAYGLALATLLGITGCSNNTETASTADAATSDPGEVTVLRFSHFMTATDDLNQQIFEPWAKKIEEDSKGRLKEIGRAHV